MLLGENQRSNLILFTFKQILLVSKTNPVYELYGIFGHNNSTSTYNPKAWSDYE